ncbi:MAG: protein kinase [Chloroflexi bacterium]|nr:protein kinase [Chloroflexota bacterium]
MPQGLSEAFGKYKIHREIGRGANAVVYEVLDTTLDRVVALKVLHSGIFADPVLVARLQREAKSAAGLDHPHIVTIYEISEWQGAHYIAEKFIAGSDLKHLIGQAGALPFDRVLRIVAQIADGLDYAHGRGLVHRDIKPSNILLGPDDYVTITDFGLVKAAESSGGLSSAGALIGTPAYIAPEVWEGQEATAQTDIYALGCVVYEMLVGRTPFDADTPAAVMRQHLMAPTPRILDSRPDLPREIQPVLERALTKSPAERYPTATALRDALAAADVSAREAEKRRLQEEEARRRAQIEAEKQARRLAQEQARREQAEERARRVREEQERRAQAREEAERRKQAEAARRRQQIERLTKVAASIIRRVNPLIGLAAAAGLIVLFLLFLLGPSLLARMSGPGLSTPGVPQAVQSALTNPGLADSASTPHPPLTSSTLSGNATGPGSILVSSRPTLPTTGRQDYLPLAPGNRWVYSGPLLPGDLTVKVMPPENISGTTTYPVEFSIPESVWWQNNYTMSDVNSSLALASYSPITVGNRPTNPAPVFLAPVVPLLGLDPKSTFQWSRPITLSGSQGKATSEVIGQERITVGAGTFDTIHARYDIEVPQWRMQVAGWYAKGIGMVRMQVDLGSIAVTLDLKEYSNEPITPTPELPTATPITVYVTATPYVVIVTSTPIPSPTPRSLKP